MNSCGVSRLIFMIFLLNLFLIESRPQSSSVKVLKDIRTQKKDGEYSYEIVLTDGTMIKQEGNLQQDDKDVGSVPNIDSEIHSPSLVISGSYSYNDTNGQVHKISYVADKNGYRPIIDGSTSTKTLSTPPPQVIIAATNETNLQPLHTISSSLFSSQSRLF